MAEKDVLALQKALKMRKRVKKKKPDFVKSESWRYLKLKEKWRRPRGIDNKMRQKVKGWPPSVNTGYRGPKEARGLHPSGYKEILVYKPEDIAKIDPKTEAARIAHTVGKKKRVQIIAEAKKRKVLILNFKPAKETPEEEAKPAETAEQPTEKETEKAPAVESKTVQKKPAAKKKKEAEAKDKEAKSRSARAKAKHAKGAEAQ
jgi:large subunit ribosomal protein L32e